MIPNSLNFYPYYQQTHFPYPTLMYFYQNTLNYANGHWNSFNQVQTQQIFTDQHHEFDQQINKQIKLEHIQDPSIINYDQTMKKQQLFDAKIPGQKEKKSKQQNSLKYYDPNNAPLLISTKSKTYTKTTFQATLNANHSNSCFEKKQKAQQINNSNQQDIIDISDDFSSSPFIILKKIIKPNLRKKLLIQRRLLRTSLLLKMSHKQSVKRALTPLILKKKRELNRNDINDGSSIYSTFKNYRPRKTNAHFIHDQQINNKKRKYIRKRYKTTCQSQIALIRANIPKKQKQINKIYKKSITENKIIQDVSKQKQL